ncbi:MAG: hypothetical protein LVS60_03520 [Nodosilinea sp. LVE1205-7]|jgi:hypothetical protein
MDNELMTAVERHREKFGEFNANIATVNFDAPGVKQRVLDAIERAIATDTPVSDEFLGFSFPSDVIL